MKTITLQNKNSYLFALVKTILFALIYYFSARICLHLATINENASPMWAPTGIAFGILVLAGKKYWPAISIGAFFANLFIGSSMKVVLPITIGNTLEACLGAYVFEWFIKQREFFGAYSQTYAFILSSMLATFVSALIGALSLCSTGVSLWKEFFPVLFTWWTGDTIGGLAFFPLIYFFADEKLRENFFQYILTILFAVLLSWLIIARPEGAPFLFFIFPFVFLCALYTNETGTTLGVVVLLISSVLSIKEGSGIFRHGSSNANLVNLQLFIGSISVTALFLNEFKKSSALKNVSFVLFGGWFFSGILFATFYKQSVQLANTEFKSVIEKIEVSIQSKMERNITALQSGAGLLVTSKNVSTEEWKTFFNQLNLDVSRDGLLGLGRISRVPKSALADYKKNRPDLNYQSLGLDDLQDAYIIDLIEPLDRNAQAIGLDIGTEMKRRNAALFSRDSGSPAISDTINLVQTHINIPGVLIYYPVYSKGPKPRTVEERRTRLIGWTYAPVVLQDFFSAVFSQKDFLRLTYSVSSANDKNHELLASSHDFLPDASETTNTLQIKIYNQIYNFKIGKSPLYLSSQDTIASWVAVFATSLTLLLAAFIVNSLSIGKQAQLLAVKMTEELKRHQMKLALSSKMSSLGEMAGGIAHEINNPLTIINSKVLVIATMLKKTNPDIPKVETELKKIEETTDRIDKIIRGLSAFARNTQGDPLEPSLISKIVEDTLELCSQRFKNHSIDLRVRLTTDAVVDCRPHQIAQVLLNLLSNAHDAVVHLPHKWVSLEIEKDNNWVYINITDSGTGINSEIIEKMMEPFFTTKEVGKGTGLGLSISKGIIEDHGGQLRYQTWQNHTRFIVQLPLVKD